MTTDDGVDLLPGASASTLVGWAAAVVVVSPIAGLVVLVVGTDRLVPPVAATGAAVVAGVAFVLGVALWVIGVRRSRAERRRGYTTFAGQVQDVVAYRVPQFVARASLGGEFVMTHRDDDVGVLLSRTPVRAGTGGLPKDGLDGFGYVEQWLARLLSERR